MNRTINEHLDKKFSISYSFLMLNFNNLFLQMYNPGHQDLLTQNNVVIHGSSQENVAYSNCVAIVEKYFLK